MALFSEEYKCYTGVEMPYLFFNDIVYGYVVMCIKLQFNGFLRKEAELYLTLKLQ